MSKEIVEEQNVPPVFLDHEQLNIQMQSTTPLDFFELYFTEDVVRLLVIKTNRYAVNFFAENPEVSETSYTGSWQDVDEVEMRTFTGLIFLMGIIYKPSIPMYWSTNNLYHTPVFQKAMRNFFIVTTTTILNMMPTMKIETDCIKYDHLLTCCMLDAKQFIHLVKT